ncbi:hypothetical protein, partial [Priestia megaterium]|uniref:hypothetical protein n=1 Tax=Priestia megaterium TaxID=1404 RepID=UPI003397974B
FDRKFTITYSFLTYSLEPLIRFYLSVVYFVQNLFHHRHNVKWCNLRKRLFKFSGLCISFSAAIYIFNYIFRPSEIDIYDFGTPLAVALSLTFFDLMFFKNKEG